MLLAEAGANSMTTAVGLVGSEMCIRDSIYVISRGRCKFYDNCGWFTYGSC